jgi:hypothetical protein
MGGEGDGRGGGGEVRRSKLALSREPRFAVGGRVRDEERETTPPRQGPSPEALRGGRGGQALPSFPAKPRPQELEQVRCFAGAPPHA